MQCSVPLGNKMTICSYCSKYQKYACDVEVVFVNLTKEEPATDGNILTVSQKRSATAPQNCRKMAATTKNYVTPQPADVLAGRSSHAFAHKGNTLLRLRIAAHLDEYKSRSSRKEKTGIIRRVLEQMCADGGRFLRYDKETHQWYNAGLDAAHSKISSHFRDAATPNKIKYLAPLKESVKAKHPMLRIIRKERHGELPRQHPPLPVAVKPVTFTHRSYGHRTNGNSNELCSLGKTPSLDSVSVLTKQCFPVPVDSTCSLYGLEPVKAPLQRGEMLFNCEQDDNRRKSGLNSVLEELSSVFYRIPSRPVSGEVRSRTSAQLTETEETESLVDLPVEDLLCPALDEVLSDLGIDDFAW